MSLRSETFEEELHARLGRDYRLRWSQPRRSWMIEQRVGRGACEAPEGLATDAAIRVRDGYALVLETQTSPHLACRVCGMDLAVPAMQTTEIKCDYCQMLYGKPTRTVAGYYPLCEGLLKRLEETSPKRGDAWAKEMKAKNLALRRSQARDSENYNEAMIKDWLPRIESQPQSGYGGTIKSNSTHVFGGRRQ